MLRLAAAVLLAAFICSPALAETRVALVIANGAYQAAALPNPPLDARLVAEGLTAIGFDVTAVIDADLESMSAALNAFEQKADGADVALFYYAGHGFAVPDRGVMRNYLMPTSADVTTTDERLLRRAGFPLDEVIDSISALAKTTLVFIDACRNDPTVRSAAGTGRGMVLEDGVGSNVFVGMSTRAGDVAQDGPIGQGSPFARAFAANIGAEGRLDDAFTRMRLAVQQETDSTQRPDTARDDLDAPLYLVASAPEPLSTPLPETGPAIVSSPTGDEVRFGLLGGFTGWTAELAKPVAAGVDLALQHINDQGGILSGRGTIIQADDGCDGKVASAAANRLANVEKVVAIIGSFCGSSVIDAAIGATTAASVVQVSPIATSVDLSTFLDYDLVFRTTPSDGYPIVKLAELIVNRGIRDVAVVHGGFSLGELANVFAAHFAKLGGRVALTERLNEDASNNSAVVARLVAAGTRTVVVLTGGLRTGYIFLEQATKADAFDAYFGDWGTISDTSAMAASGVTAFGAVAPVSYQGAGALRFAELAAAKGLRDDLESAAMGYDAAFVLALAVQRNGRDRTTLYLAMRQVANPPGERILPGEWSKALALLAAGEDIDYEGAATTLDFDPVGDVAGTVAEVALENGALVQLGPVP